MEALHVKHENGGPSDGYFKRHGHGVDRSVGRGVLNYLSALAGIVSDYLNGVVDLFVLNTDYEGRVSGLKIAAGGGKLCGRDFGLCEGARNRWRRRRR